MTFDKLRAQTDAQALEIRAQLIRRGHLPPPPETVTLSREQVPASLEALKEALVSCALTWGQVAAPGSTVFHYANGLFYCGAMLASCEQVERDPSSVLAMFAAWAAGFVCQVLEDCGQTKAQAGAALDHLGEHPAAITGMLEALPHDMARGAFIAALCVFQAAVLSTAQCDPAPLYTLFSEAGQALTEPDLTPRTGEGLRA
ncbi:hypothetical protein [Deinococcus sp.]|uniref:hypothetical protein n=1 Tax=Deinococcus sp. TaxID=47478 RepID=UPI0025BC5705|nr:hypothetical protein [Deinococcus sp.]